MSSFLTRLLPAEICELVNSVVSTSIGSLIGTVKFENLFLKDKCYQNTDYDLKHDAVAKIIAR